ncbi:MAG: hypothetical protein ABIJ04_05840 [Bacteroidota bacterium]
MTILAIMLLLWMSCSRKESPPPSGSIYSVNGGTTSHKNGKDCISCHKAGGTGNYAFGVAGSVYKPDLITPSPDGILYFWTKAGGTGLLVATLEVDSNGNFFTTSSILPALGAYPQMRGISGDIKTMPILAPTGNCNSCHGGTENPIWIN